MDRKTKSVFHLDSPFTDVNWPQTSVENQETILELLCSLLSPIGFHRANHVIPSKGKRDRKRKRKALRSSGEHPVAPDVPAPPEISQFVVVGLNSVHRRLEMLSKSSNPKLDPNDQDPSSLPSAKGEHFVAIFALRPPQLPILQSHIPQLIQTASLAYSDMPPTRLVQLPNRSDIRICEALKLSRVSFVGILSGAPHADALVQLVQECIPQVEIPWLMEARSASYMPLKVLPVETPIPSAKGGRTKA